MRVALISSEFAGLPGSGGIGTYFDHLARGLSESGCEVEVFTSGGGGDLPPRQGVVFHHLGERAWPEFPVAAGLAFQAQHNQKPFDVLECAEFMAEGGVARKLVPDVALTVRIHSPSIILDRYLDFHPSLFERTKKIFFQITGTIGACRRGLPLRPILLEPFSFAWVQSRDVEERNFAASADAVVAMNEEMRRFAMGHWWVEPSKLHLVPNPYLPEKSPEHAVVCRPPNGKTLGFLGRFEPRKGVVELAKALEEVLPEFPDWRVRIAGTSVPSCVSGADAGKIAREILKDSDSQVLFEGRVEPSKVTSWLQGVDVCVFPGLWESFSYVTLEAAEAGRAIIGTETGAVPEILDGGRAGLIVRPGDKRGLAKALRKLMADGELRSGLGDAAKRRFEERFHPDRVMGEILEVYREAVLRAEARR
jgi:glycosyltransferase involved in cell wall biosynthesis